MITAVPRGILAVRMICLARGMVKNVASGGAMQSSDQERPIRAPGRYDQTLKWMLTQAHDSFLALIAPSLKWQVRSGGLPGLGGWYALAP